MQSYKVSVLSVLQYFRFYKSMFWKLATRFILSLFPESQPRPACFTCVQDIFAKSKDIVWFTCLLFCECRGLEIRSIADKFCVTNAIEFQYENTFISLLTRTLKEDNFVKGWETFVCKIICCCCCCWWWWWIVFVVWLIDQSCLALFPAGTIVSDLHHRESLTRREQDLNLRKMWV